jgi:phospholipid/cholesterol/gamma-HCH transport system substrate-binding protein
MKATSGQKIKIGVFIIAGLLVLFFGIFLIGNQKSMFTSTFRVYGVFKNVNGLMVGNNVRFAGINIGVVEGINIVTDSTVRVDLTLNNNVKKFIKQDAKVAIGSDGLMGDKLVTISPGAGNSDIVKDGQKLVTVNPVDVDKIIARITKVADNAADLSESLSGIFKKVNNGKGTLGRLISNDRMARDLETTVASAKTTVRNVNTSTQTLNEDLKAAQNNFLLRGFFKKKRKAEKARQDSIDKAHKEAEKAAKKKD